MKKLFIIILMLISISAFSQRTVPMDSINGSETVSFGTMLNAKVVQAVCTEVGGTSAGTLTLWGSIDDSNWTNLNFNLHNLGVASPYASLVDSTAGNRLTIVDGLVASWVINTDEYPYTKVVGIGESSDSTQVNIYYRR